jgi:plasmid maintenance system antidote protein VapI
LFAGHEVREKNEMNENVFDASEVFPDSNPGTILRGFRFRESLTQKDLAQMAGLKPHHVSEMETGKRPIDKEVAERLAKALNADRRVFYRILILIS